MYDIKVLNNKCKMGGGDVGPQCFVKDLLWVVNLVCKKEDSVSCWFKTHQPRQGQRPIDIFFLVLPGFFFVFFFFFTDLKTSLNNFIHVHLTVISPHHAFISGHLCVRITTYFICLARTKVGARQPLLKTHTTTWTDCFTFTSANKIL